MSVNSGVVAAVPVAEPVGASAVFEVGRAVEFRDILKVLGSTLEEASFKVGEEGISIRGMDPSHVAMIDLMLPREFFDVYRVMRGGVFCVNLDEVMRVVFRKVLRDTDLRVVLGEVEGRVLFELRDDLLRRKFVPDLQVVEMEVPEPRVVHKCSLRVGAKAFKRVIEDFYVFEHLTIKGDVRRVVFSSAEDMGREEIPLGADNVNVLGIKCGEPVSSTYTLHYLRILVKTIPAVCDVVELRFSGDMPLEIVFELRGAGRLSWWLAPCVGV